MCLLRFECRLPENVWSAAVLEAPVHLPPWRDSESFCSLNPMKKLSKVQVVRATMGNNQKESHNVTSTCTRRCGISHKAALTPLEHAHKILGGILQYLAMWCWQCWKVGVFGPSLQQKGGEYCGFLLLHEALSSKHSKHKPPTVLLIFCLWEFTFERTKAGKKTSVAPSLTQQSSSSTDSSSTACATKMQSAHDSKERRFCWGKKKQTASIT